MAESQDQIYARGSALALRGEDEAARAALLEVLAIDPTHFAALTDLASLALKTGHRSAALTAYRQAAQRHPDNPRGLVNLANLLLDDEANAEAQDLYRSALVIDPALAYAHQGLAVALERLGDAAEAEKHRVAGFKNNSVVVRPYRGTGTPLRVLLLVSATGGNIPTSLILDDRIFAVTAIYADYHDVDAPLPDHDVLFNAIGDADLCGKALINAETLVRRSTAPRLNPPHLIRNSGRLANADRLSALPDVLVPRMRRYPRNTLEALDAAAMLERDGFNFPLLVRSPGFHTGQNFARIESEDRLGEAVAQLTGDALLAIEFCDVRGADGLSRKYRVMFIDGELFPLHLALSQSWKVHYFTSAMAENKGLRREEGAFLHDMTGALGSRAVQGLRQVQEALGLHYGGADFAIAPDGRLLLFEANATMAIVPPPPDPIWDYRRRAVTHALDAARSMLFVRGEG